MPTPHKTISATDAGVFTPGTKVTSAHHGWDVGTCIVPYQEAIDGMPRYDCVYVCWPDGTAEWVYPNLLTRIDR